MSTVENDVTWPEAALLRDGRRMMWAVGASACFDWWAFSSWLHGMLCALGNLKPFAFERSRAACHATRQRARTWPLCAHTRPCVLAYLWCNTRPCALQLPAPHVRMQRRLAAQEQPGRGQSPLTEELMPALSSLLPRSRCVTQKICEHTSALAQPACARAARCRLLLM
jgi:hypothetical protein